MSFETYVEKDSNFSKSCCLNSWKDMFDLLITYTHFKVQNKINLQLEIQLKHGLRIQSTQYREVRKLHL